jgi:leader peptidase (prepilin peptidase)/N-methyltransferase
MISILGTTFAALLGLAFGSFLNVCLSRWPEGESVVKPRSHCRNCARTLAWWENIPLFSWLALRGRCRTCGVWIGWRYPAVELAIAVLWSTAAWRFLESTSFSDFPDSAFYDGVAALIGRLIFFWLLVALAMLDGENFWLPNWLTLPGIAIGFAFSIVPIPLFSDTFAAMTGLLSLHLSAAIDSLLSISIAALLILLIRWTYKLIRHREGIGLGDAKLMAMLGAWLGLPGAFLSFGIGVFLGAIFALTLLAVPAVRRGPETWTASKLPLGTFLCIGGIVSALWGQPIIHAYLRWAGF